MKERGEKEGEREERERDKEEENVGDKVRKIENDTKRKRERKVT